KSIGRYRAYPAQLQRAASPHTPGRAQLEHGGAPMAMIGSAARRRRRSRSDLLGPVAVGVGDYFHHVTVGVLEIDAATAVQMIDLAGLGAPRIGVIPAPRRAEAGERRVDLGVADKERVMPRTNLFARIKIEGHAVRRLDRDKMAPFRPRLETEDVGEE